LSARTIIVAGAGIGGLTAALALAQKGFRVEVLDQVGRLEEAGAGIQLSPNATRVLIGLGLREALLPAVVVPDEFIVTSARGRAIARMPLGTGAAVRYGAPYWIIHRSDLQAALLAAVTAHHDIALTLGRKVDAYAAHANGVTVQAARGSEVHETHGAGLVGADGLWSSVRRLAGDATPPRFARRSAYRALLPAEQVAPALRAPAVHLWLGHGAHLVAYPVKAGSMINIVAIARDTQPGDGWSIAAAAADVRARFSRFWAQPARDLLALPTQWLKWPLHDRPPQRLRGEGPVTLIGDAAHPMLPFVAQGAAMAIEDAAVLAAALAAAPDNPASAMRCYEAARAARTAQVQRAARRNDTVYHLAWPASAARNWAMGRMGSDGLLARFDWIYDWRAE
jgi:2-polyprenyl-6-methoxyphenol hydroxylase-like FAD-dependent oxidoreductase